MSDIRSALARPVRRRSDHRRGDRQRPLLHRRRDGRGAGPRQLLHQHQGAARLLDRALRRERPDALPGRAHPDASRQLHRHHRRIFSKRHPVETMRPGDVFIGNDAYEGGGTHLPDIVLAEPIFVEGELVAWAVNTAHHADFADRGHAHIYQEGLRIPPIRLYRAGELQEDVQELILLNCQVPRERLSDLRAQMAANRLGVQRMQALCAKYGARDGAGGRRGAAGLCGAQDARRHRRDPRRHLSLRRPLRQSEIDRRAALLGRDQVAGDEMRAALRQPAAGPRRLQHGLHGAARRPSITRSRPVVDPTHPAECRARAAADRDGAEGHDPQLRASRGGRTGGSRPASASST